jgi:hypothetical protein
MGETRAELRPCAALLLGFQRVALYRANPSEEIEPFAFGWGV